MDWALVRTTFSDMNRAVADLLRETTDLDRPALGSWTVRDLASHMAHVWEFDAVQAGGAPEPIDDLHKLADLTGRLVAGESDPSPQALATRVEEAGQRFLATTETLDPSEMREWFGGIRLPVDGLASHAVSEALVHGHDLATATGRPWPIPRQAAAVAMTGFNFRVMASPAAHGFVLDWDAAGDLHATFEIRLRTGERVWFVFEGRGNFRLETAMPSGKKVDCTVLADPAALLLVVWKRRSQWSAIARGQLLAWGRKPWLGLKLTSIFNTP